MADVQRADLTDIRRTLALWQDACRRGHADPSDAGRLRFVAMAQHALRKGDNPMRLFASNVRKGRWGHVTQADEEAAARRLKEHVHGPPRPPEPRDDGASTSAARPTRRPLSSDATWAQAAMFAARNRPHPEDAAIASLRSTQPREDWTRERFETALAEVST